MASEARASQLTGKTASDMRVSSWNAKARFRSLISPNSLTTHVVLPGKKEVIDYHSSKIFRFSIVIGNLRFADMVSDIITVK